MDEENVQPEEDEAGTDYEMKEVQNTGHIHAFLLQGTDASGWEIWQCACGSGYGKPKS